MIYGLLGEKLGHSFSKEIHQRISDYTYNLIEVSKEDFPSFMKEKKFKAINVTIPYKEMVIPYMDYIDSKAQEINAINTVVNKDGLLYGYNTDYLGLKALIENNNIKIENKKVLVLGTGGTSKTASVVLKDLKAKEVIFVSRSKRENTVTYEEVKDFHNDADVIVNTSPSGMYPNVEGLLVDLDWFTNLTAVVDVVYNPLNTKIVQKALKKGIKAVTGLYMLVAQAVYASSIFLDKQIDESLIDIVYQELLLKKENIVLIGMPSCGKSTIGKLIASKLDKEFVDSDEEIEKRIGMKIKDFLSKDNEEEFRNIETEVIKELSLKNNLVISTGGGVIKKEINIEYLKFNGKVFFIDRPLELLQATSSRPLSNTFDALSKLYHERYPIYLKSTDVVVKNDKTIEEIIKLIINYLRG